MMETGGLCVLVPASHHGTAYAQPRSGGRESVFVSHCKPQSSMSCASCDLSVGVSTVDFDVGAVFDTLMGRN